MKKLIPPTNPWLPGGSSYESETRGAAVTPGQKEIWDRPEVVDKMERIKRAADDSAVSSTQPQKKRTDCRPKTITHSEG